MCRKIQKPFLNKYLYIYMDIYLKWFLYLPAYNERKRKEAPPRRYPYFDVVGGLEWSDDPESYAGGSICYQQGLPCQTGQR